MGTLKATVFNSTRPRSLRLRLILWYSTLLTVAVGVFAFLFLFLTTDAIEQSVESAIRAEARIASLEVQRQLVATPPYWPPHLSLPAVDIYSEPGVVVEVLDARGHSLYLSTSGNSMHIPVSAETTRATVASQPVVWYNTSIGGQHVRVGAFPIRAPDGASDGTNASIGTGPVVGTLLVTKSLSDVDNTLLLLRLLLLLCGMGTLVGALLGSWVLASRVLQPLSELVKTARVIAASTARGTRLGNLSQRVRPTGGRDEMAQVVEAFNEMLASLESATQTQRRFVADASHELRAPLTTIQGNLAFLQRHYDDLPAEERRTMLVDAHVETLRLAELVEELLLLARADANVDTSLVGSGTKEITEESAIWEPPVELDHAVLQLVRQLRRRLSAEGSKLKLEIGHIEPVRVRGNEENLRRITLILLDNALKYTPVGDK
jgi:signal transduction histidine kinase